MHTKCTRTLHIDNNGRSPSALAMDDLHLNVAASTPSQFPELYWISEANCENVEEMRCHMPTAANVIISQRYDENILQLPLG